MSEHLIELQHISKIFPGVRALNDVNFTLEPGEVHVLLGENGAGKSTLIKILSGLYHADEGEIWIRGEKKRFTGPKSAEDAGIATIYQELNLCENMNVAENIFLGRLPNKAGVVNQKLCHQMARNVLDELNLDYDTGSIVSEMGVAQKQMIEIAKSISRDTQILILDEPTAVLTEKEITELFKVIHLLKEKGVGIIYISHRLQELHEIGDRITVLRDGNYIATVNVCETSEDELVALMVGREIKDKFPTRNSKIGDVLFRAEHISTKDKVRDVTLEVHAGEIVGMAGLVGSGRTEFARAVFGADPRSGGKIYINGEEVFIHSPLDAIEHGLGFVTEERKKDGLVLIASVCENISLASRRQSSKGIFADLKKQKETALKYVDKIRIKTPSLKQQVVNLSGGNQQKVILAKWLSANAKVIIFDEPTRGIDVGAKAEVYQLMNQLLENGAGIIMISSELPEIMGMSDRILVMREGALTGEIAKNEFEQKRILSVMLDSDEN
ncbi:MAG: sugar ABC transporter ATP-binding protein [Eubacteriales bacterium]|nr:sugar ABC transporter ATP-binding protein [Eubacteriales bacterium]